MSCFESPCFLENAYVCASMCECVCMCACAQTLPHVCEFHPQRSFFNRIFFPFSSVAVGDSDVSGPDGHALLKRVC